MSISLLALASFSRSSFFLQKPLQFLNLFSFTATSVFVFFTSIANRRYQYAYTCKFASKIKKSANPLCILHRSLSASHFENLNDRLTTPDSYRDPPSLNSHRLRIPHSTAKASVYLPHMYCVCLRREYGTPLALRDFSDAFAHFLSCKMVYTSVSIFNFFLLRLLILFRRHPKTEKFACGLAFKIEKKPQQCNCSGAGTLFLWNHRELTDLKSYRAIIFKKVL